MQKFTQFENKTYVFTTVYHKRQYKLVCEATQNPDGTFALYINNEQGEAFKAAMASTGLSIDRCDLSPLFWGETASKHKEVPLFKFMRKNATFEDHELCLDSVKRGFNGFEKPYINDMGTCVILLH